MSVRLRTRETAIPTQRNINVPAPMHANYSVDSHEHAPRVDNNTRHGRARAQGTPSPALQRARACHGLPSATPWTPYPQFKPGDFVDTQHRNVSQLITCPAAGPPLHCTVHSSRNPQRARACLGAWCATHVDCTISSHHKEVHQQCCECMWRVNCQLQSLIATIAPQREGTSAG